MGTPQEHIARNDAMISESNRLHGELAVALKQHTVRLSCECGRALCGAEVNATVEQHVAVRSHPRWFLVVSGHEIPDVDTVVERTSNCIIVERPQTFD